MSRKFNIILATYFIVLSSIFSQRTLYVDNFNGILGNHKQEVKLLTFAQENNFNAIILYELHKVSKRFPLGKTPENNVLADFIYSAKTNYGIEEVIASGESGGFFINEIAKYNDSRKISSEKFDVFNLEYEYWSKTASDYGGYYCENYLRKNGIKCSKDGNFKYFIETLSIMKLLSQESEHPIKIEAYVARYNKRELNTIAKYVDRILVSAYSSNPNVSFVNIKKNLNAIAELPNKPKVSVIFSSEIDFMGGYLKYNSLHDSESEFLNNFNYRNLNLDGFTYYNYSELNKSLEYFRYRTTGIVSR